MHFNVILHVLYVRDVEESKMQMFDGSDTKKEKKLLLHLIIVGKTFICL